MSEILSDDKEKLFSKNCMNFIKVITEGKSEEIKINYWKTLENFIENTQISNESTFKNIFEIFRKHPSLMISNKNLFFCVYYFLSSKSISLLRKNFFEFVLMFIQDFKGNKHWLSEYLGDTAMNLFFEHQDESDKGGHELFRFIIENDYQLFLGIFFNYLSSNPSQDFFNSSTNQKLFILLFQKLLLKRKWKFILLTLQKFTFASFPLDLAKTIIEKTIENGFGPRKIKEKNIPFFFQFHFFILSLFANYYSDLDKDLMCKYFLMLLSSMIQHKTFYHLIISIIIDYDNKYHLNDRLKSVFPIISYALQNFVTNPQQVKFYKEKIFPNIPSVYQWLILKKFTEQNKICYLPTKPEVPKFSLEVSSINSSFKLDNSLANYDEVVHLALIDYMIKYPIKEDSGKLIVDESLLIEVLNTIISLDLAHKNEEVFNSFVLLAIDLITLLLESSISSENKISIKVFERFIQLISKATDQFQVSKVYPGIIYIMKNYLISNYDSFYNQKNQRNEVINFFFDYLLREKFSRDEEISTLTTKLLLILYNMKTKISKEHKLFSFAKLVTLCKLSNSGKIFNCFFNFCDNVLKKKTEANFVYYALYSYAEVYEGALPDAFLNFVMQKFSSLIGKSTLDEITVEMIFYVATLGKLYSKDKPHHLKKMVEDLCLSNKFLNDLKKLCEKTSISSNYFVCNDINNYNKLKQQVNSIHFNYLILKVIDNEKIDNTTLLYSFTKYYSNFIGEYMKTFFEEKFKKGGKSKENVTVSQETKEDPKLDSINEIFDFIYKNLLLIENKVNAHAIILNEIFKREILIRYFNFDHSNLFANKMIQEADPGAGLNYSQLEEIIFSISSEKSNQFMSYITSNQGNALLMIDMIFAYFREGKQFLHNLNQKPHPRKHVIIKTINKSSLLSNNDKNVLDKIKLTNLEQERSVKILRSLLTTRILNRIFNKKNLSDTTIIFALLFENEFFTWFEESYFIFFNYEVIQLVSYCITKANPSFIGCFYDLFIKNIKASNEPFHLLSLRILSSQELYNSLCANKCQRQKYQMIVNLFSNLIYYNSSQKETIQTLTNILNNVTNRLISSSEQGQFDEEIVFYSGLMKEIFEMLNKGTPTKSSSKLQTKHPKTEINPNLKNALNEKLSEVYLPQYISYFYCCLCSFYTKKSKDPNVTLLIEAYFRIQQIRKHTDITKNIKEENALRFFKKASYDIATLSNATINKIYNDFLEYTSKGDEIGKRFNEDLFIFALLSKSKEKKKNFYTDTIKIFNNKDDVNKLKFCYTAIICFLQYQSPEKEILCPFEIASEVGKYLSKEVIEEINNSSENK